MVGLTLGVSRSDLYNTWDVYKNIYDNFSELRNPIISIISMIEHYESHRQSGVTVSWLPAHVIFKPHVNN